MEFTETFLSQAREIAGYDPAHGPVLAVSGGPDSMALLQLHSRLSGTPPVVAHLDHHLRPGSAADAEFVRKQAARRNALFVKGDWTSHAKAQGIGIEAAARRARYAFLAEVARQHGRTVVATGHHRDDQAETVMHRVLRGAGPDGLRGIHVRRALGEGLILVRPLLPFGRAEILEYLRRHQVPWREDPTNRDGGNLRATIRARLIPFLKQEVGDVTGRLAGLSMESASRTWPLPPRGEEIPPEVRRRPILLHAAIHRILDGAGPPLEARTMKRIRVALEKRCGVVDLGRGYRLRVSGTRVLVLAPDA